MANDYELRRLEWLRQADSHRKQAETLEDKARCYPEGSAERNHYEYFAMHERETVSHCEHKAMLAAIQQYHRGQQ